MTDLITYTGSVLDVANKSGKSIAETFLSCDVITIIDTSGSMGAQDDGNALTRYERACHELEELQAHLQGRIAVISFSDQAMFCPGGKPLYLGGGTHMANALQFTKVADIPGVRFILISDGEPYDEEETLKIAAGYKNKIDTIYIGAEESPTGRDFLTRLSHLTGGRSVNIYKAKELSAGIERLLLTA